MHSSGLPALSRDREFNFSPKAEICPWLSTSPGKAQHPPKWKFLRLEIILTKPLDGSVKSIFPSVILITPWKGFTILPVIKKPGICTRLKKYQMLFKSQLIEERSNPPGKHSGIVGYRNVLNIRRIYQHQSHKFHHPWKLPLMDIRVRMLRN